MQRPRFYLVLRRLVMSRRSIFHSAWLIKRKCGGGQYEDILKGSDDPTGAHRQSKACATVVFLSTRMEAVCLPSRLTCVSSHVHLQAWKEGNHSMAEYMAQRITGTIITSHSIGMLASAEILIHVMLSDDDEQRLTLLPPHQVCPRLGWISQVMTNAGVLWSVNFLLSNFITSASRCSRVTLVRMVR